MIIRRAYKYRLKPTADQAARLRVLCGHARFVWNHGLAECLRRNEADEKIPSYAALCKLLTGWKKDPELLWLGEAYTDNLQQKLKDLHAAWGRFFEHAKAGDVARAIAERKTKGEPVKHLPFSPRFKKKSDNNDSIRFVNFNKYCQLDGRRVKLPSRLGWLKFRMSQPVIGNMKNCTVSWHAGHWYISFQVEQEIVDPVHPSTSAVGLDMGVAKFVTLSDGTFEKPLSAYRKHEQLLAIEQRKLSRKVKFSANWKKQKAKIQRLHSKVANCRSDYLHKTSTTISKNHAMIAIEDLRISNMAKSARGSVEQPGRNIKAKAGLSKSILDQGWFEFRRQLEYKQSWRGGMVVAVPAAYTSRTCPNCGYESAKNRETQAKFECKSCSYSANADVVGAINVLRAGHAQLACEVNRTSGQQQELASRVIG